MPRDPRLVAFLCDGCAYAAADAAGRARLEVPHELLSIRVVCTGRVEPALVLQAFREGADGVLVAGCHPGECHHGGANLAAASRFELLSATLRQLGVPEGRFRLEWIGAGQPDRFALVAREMVEGLRALGPLEYAGRLGPAAAPLAVPEAAPRAPGRPRVAFWWNSSCGGCEEAVVDLGPDLAPLLGECEVVLWPFALDYKRRDVEALPDGSIDVAFLNGAVRLEDQLEWSRLLRRKARRLVAVGACAQLGGVVGLGNLTGPGEIEAAARTPLGAAAPEPVAPRPGEPRLPPVLARVVPLTEVVEVDAILPGCPPSPELVLAAVRRLLDPAPLRPAEVLAPDLALCERCPRRETMPERLELTALRRLGTTQPDPATCFLAQGLLCMGPATRQGCGDDCGCVGANVPCRGCFGPLDGVRDQGAAFLAALGTLLAAPGERGLRALARTVPDPAGTFYRYGLAAATLPARTPLAAPPQLSPPERGGSAAEDPTSPPLPPERGGSAAGDPTSPPLPRERGRDGEGARRREAEE
ncbi:hydrogenase iron-sulfur subunit [Anaeromyxobacter paludicola]|uniref:Methyl-viologen-reducing hydrogenase delta subunit n=1 Tax=Anaeromyxobacter paludicola TaxID=2918171 RepID=A0ABM7XDI5_9BACT|nr:hydrogenase iron-sulfur subunit [Anaeromyxobacter paludicola]BDG09928.1 hypothetical protein AMPC_30410 [Anaeromyxobacter paludicola]